MPKVSVIIPSYNHEKYIAETIQSVLDQTYQDFEIVIVDDGSTDGTVNEIKKFKDPRIRLFYFEKNRGATSAARKLLEEAHGDYIAVLSSDDVYMPEKLKKQVCFLDGHQHIGAVFSYAHIIDENGKDFTDDNHFYFNIFKQPNRTRYDWLNYFFYKGNCLCHPSILIRKVCYDTIGYYDERFAQLPDFDFWIRLCMKYEIHIIPENLIKFRIRAGEANASGNRPDAKVRGTWEYIQILRNYLNIKFGDDFRKIFPEYHDEDEINEELIPFLVAQLAIKVDNPSYRFFGIDTQYQLFRDLDIAKQIGERYKVGYIDLIKLTALYDVFNVNTNLISTDLKLQVFWSSGKVYSETNSIGVRVEADGETRSYELILPLPDATPLRIDPVNYPAFVEIQSIELYTDAMVLVNCSVDNAFDGLSILRGAMHIDSQQSFSLLCLDDDPQICFNYNLNSEPPGPVNLRLTSRVEKIHPNIAAILNNEFDNRNKQWEEYVAQYTNQLSKIEAESNKKLSKMEAESNKKLSKIEAESNKKLSKMEAESNNKLSKMEAELLIKENEILRLQDELDNKQQIIGEIHASRSWRYTAPLRWMEMIRKSSQK